MRDYIYVDDIAQAFLKASIYEGEHKVFNIGSGKGYKIMDLINIIEHITHEHLQIKYFSGRSFDVPINVLDISKAQMYLGWQPTVELQEGISRAFNWMNGNQFGR